MATPFGWCQVRPAYATGGEIFTVVLHHAEKCFVGSGDCTFEIPHDNSHNIGLDQTPDLGFQPTRQLTDFCFRLFALGHLNFELFYVCQRLIRGRRKFPQRGHDPVILCIELAAVAVHDSPYGSYRLAVDVKRDQQALFGRRIDWHQIGITPFEVGEQQRTILIEHVSARPEIARGSTSDVGIPHAGDGWPIEPLAINVRRFAIPRQQAQASGVTLRNILDRLRKCPKDGSRRVS